MSKYGLHRYSYRGDVAVNTSHPVEKAKPVPKFIAPTPVKPVPPPVAATPPLKKEGK